MQTNNVIVSLWVEGRPTERVLGPTIGDYDHNFGVQHWGVQLPATPPNLDANRLYHVRWRDPDGPHQQGGIRYGHVLNNHAQFSFPP